MKIDLVKIKLSQCDKYKYKPIKWCCDEIKNNPMTLFTKDDLVRIEGWDYQKHPQMCLNFDYVVDYEDNYEITKNYPIKYCPWCGEKIDINVVDELDMISRERKIFNELEKLMKKEIKVIVLAKELGCLKKKSCYVTRLIKCMN